MRIRSLKASAVRSSPQGLHVRWGRFPGSSNGKTRAFGAWNGGSIPPPGTATSYSGEFPVHSEYTVGRTVRTEPRVTFLLRLRYRATAPDAPSHARAMIHQSLLVATFVAWAVICLCGAVVLLRRAPAVSIALFGTVLGAIAGFLVGNADGPAEVPAYTAVAASVGLFVGGVGGLLTDDRAPSGQGVALARGVGAPPRSLRRRGVDGASPGRVSALRERQTHRILRLPVQRSPRRMGQRRDRRVPL